MGCVHEATKRPLIIGVSNNNCARPSAVIFYSAYCRPIATL